MKDLRIWLPGALSRLVIVLAVAGLGSLAAGASAWAGARDKKVTLMTRNVYIGTDVTQPLTATSPADLELIATDMFRQVQETDFRIRAKALAKEIDRAKPDLVGLQEVALIRTDTPADGPPSLGGTPARHVVYDYLRILKAKLRRRHAPYRVVQVQRGADAEIPTTLGFDVRATDRDVILARRSPRVRTRNSSSHQFRSAFEGSLFNGAVRFRINRGWTATSARVGKARFRLVNTHLEAADPLTRRDQARELVAAGGPASARKPVVLLGDLNSDDDTAHGKDRLAYRVIRKAGFVERSTSVPSCCYQDPTLEDPTERFDHQVDHILVDRRRIKLVRSFVTGNDPKERVGGLWPSDHGGVVSVLRFR